MSNTVFLIGNAHLDPVWLWRRAEGYAEIKATFLSALERMREFPDYVFTAAGASYYQWIHDSEPELFAEIRQRVAEGRWAIAGGMWVQPDCNLPSGEAFARHMLYAQRLFQEYFGDIAHFGYNVDSFGHNGMLPQLLRQGGMDAYVFMRPDAGENPGLPKDAFLWESPDGSRVLTYKIPLGYNDASMPKSEYPQYGQMDKYEAQVREIQRLGALCGHPMMSFYGVGNHGGGPTICSLKTLERVVREDGSVRFAGPQDYFDEMRAAVGEETLPVVKTDLQHHASGCYAANSTVKMMNFTAEHALVAAEKMDWLSHKLTASPLRTEALQIAWEKVLFHQFHDILAGCSIRSAYEEAYHALGAALDTAWEVGNFAMQRLSWRVDTTAIAAVPGREDAMDLFRENGDASPYVVFNPHSFPVKSCVRIPWEAKEVCDSKGNPLPLQHVRAERTNVVDLYETLFQAEVPALGWASFYAYYRQAKQPLKLKSVLDSSAESGDYRIENDKVAVTFDPYTGWITSFMDLDTEQEYAGGPMAKPVIIRDYETDTWSHRVFAFHEELGCFTDAKLRILEEGPLRVTMRVESFYNRSSLIQDFSLCRGERALRVSCFLNFQEQLKIARLSFPVNIENPQAVYAMPYGFCKKEPDGLEEPGNNWLQIETTDKQMKNNDKQFGIGLAISGKYSYNVQNNIMNVTIARGCIFADHYGCRDDRVEFQDQGEQRFRYVLLPQDAADYSAIVREAALLGQPLQVIKETQHKGPLGADYEGLRVSAPNCVAEVVKGAQDDGATVLRLYETAGLPTETEVEVPALGARFSVTLRPQEIRTVLLRENGEILETNFLEDII